MDKSGTVAHKYIARQKPRILFVTNTIAPYTKPFFLGLSQIYDIQFIFTDMPFGKEMYGVDMLEESNGFDEMAYRVRKRYFRQISPSGIPLGLLLDLWRERYDVVVAVLGSVEMVFGFLATRLRRKPIVLENGMWRWEGKLGERNPDFPFTRFIVPHSDAIAVPGTKHKEYVISLGACPDKVFIMPLASNIVVKEDDYAKAKKLRTDLNIGTRKVILYVGRLVRQKGVSYLIEAFSRLRKERDGVTLLIVGEGNSKTELETLARNLGIADSVYFAGFVSNEELSAYYLLCDICVVPSITYVQADPWVRAVNDAMNASKPVVATNAVGAAFDMIRDGENGFIVPERDSHALHQAIKKIISEPELAKRMGEEAKRTVEQGFEYEHMIRGFMEAVNSISRVKKGIKREER